MITSPDYAIPVGRGPEAGTEPLIDPSADVAGLLADAAIVLQTPLLGPVRILRLERFDQPFDYQIPTSPGDAGSPTGPHGADVVLGNAAGGTILDTRSTDYTYSGEAYGPRLWMHRWFGPGGYIELVQRRGFAPDAPVQRYAPAIAPSSATLIATVCQASTRALTAVRVGNLGTTEGLTLECGYNLSIGATPMTSGLRTGSALTISALPGQGAGKYPGCSDEHPPVRRIGSATPSPSGNLTLSLTDCLWVRPVQVTAGDEQNPTVSVTPGTLILGNDCPPCSPCSDFVTLKSAIDAEWARMQDISAKAEATRDALKDVIDRWKLAGACRDASAASVAVYVGGRQFADIQSQLCNRSEDCLIALSAIVAIKIEPPTPFTVVTGTSFATDASGVKVRTDPLHDGDQLVFNFDQLESGRSASFRFRIELHAAPDGTTVTAFVGWLVDGDGPYWLPQSASGSDYFRPGEGLEGVDGG